MPDMKEQKAPTRDTVTAQHRVKCLNLYASSCTKLTKTCTGFARPVSDPLVVFVLRFLKAARHPLSYNLQSNVPVLAGTGGEASRWVVVNR